MNRLTARQRFNQSRINIIEITKKIKKTGSIKAQIEGIWTLTDILGHITTWEITIIAPLKQLVTDGLFQPVIIADGEKFNLEQAGRRKKMTLDEILEEMTEVRSQVNDLLDHVNDDQWENEFPTPWGSKETLTQIIAGLTWHEEEHLKPIKQYFEEMSI